MPSLAVLLLLIAALAQSTRGTDWDPDHNPLTVGPNNEFMVGIYQMWTSSNMVDAAAHGFNVVHSYSFRNASGTQNPSYSTPDEFASRAESYGLSVIMQLGVVVPSEPDVPMPVQADIQYLATHPNIAMWAIAPEEISYYPAGNANFNQLVQWANNVHTYDPLGRPVYHYLASNYAEVDLKAYTGSIDAIGPGAYADHASKPRPWIRWRIEQEVNAIRNTGSRDGAFPIAMLQMFASEGYPGETTMQAADGYHDAYLSLVSGAKAVVVFTGARKNEIPGLYNRYGDFAKEINGPERLGDVFLKGIDLGEFSKVKPSILAGPTKSEAFTTSFAWPPSGPTVQYDSVSYRVMAHQEHLYISAVNSAESPVMASFPAVRATAPVDVLFQNRQVVTANNHLTDQFTALGANNYRLPAGASLAVAEELFDGPDGAVAGWTPVNGNGAITNAAGVTTVSRGTAPTEYLRRDLSALNLPLGGFLELQVKADPTTQYYLELIDPQGGSAALVNWQGGTGGWQTLRADFSGSWRPSGSLWLGIRGGNNYEIGQLGVYFKAASNNSWNHDGNGDWSDATSWLDASIPNGGTQTAVFGGALTNPATIYTNATVTVVGIDFNNANSYAIAGQGTVTLNAGVSNSTINVFQGTHEFQASVRLESNTTAHIEAGTKLSLNNTLFLNGNSLTVTGGGAFAINNRVRADGGSIVLAGGSSLAGSGSLSGNLENLDGLLSPGNSPGIFHINGDYEQGDGGSLLIELAGTEAGISYDRLAISGTASFNGDLELVLLDHYQPMLGSYFDVLSFMGSIGTVFTRPVVNHFGTRASHLFVIGGDPVCGRSSAFKAFELLQRLTSLHCPGGIKMKTHLQINFRYQRDRILAWTMVVAFGYVLSATAETVTVWEEQFNTNNAQWEFYPNPTGLALVSQAVPGDVIGAEDGFEGRFSFTTPNTFPGGGIRYAILTIPVPVLAGDRVEYSIRTKSPTTAPNNFSPDRINLVAPAGGTDFDSGFQNHDTADGLTYQKEPGTYFDLFDTTLPSNLRPSQNLWLGLSGNSVSLGAQAVFYIDYIRIIGERTGVPGDYNGNKVVDAIDYVVWRKNLGTNVQLLNEVPGTTPGSVTSEDYVAWRARFGNPSGSGSELGSMIIPEPTGACLATIGLLILNCVFRRQSLNASAVDR
jgi:hypothetical protein